MKTGARSRQPRALHDRYTIDGRKIGLACESCQGAKSATHCAIAIKVKHPCSPSRWLAQCVIYYPLDNSHGPPVVSRNFAGLHDGRRSLCQTSTVSIFTLTQIIQRSLSPGSALLKSATRRKAGASGAEKSTGASFCALFAIHGEGHEPGFLRSGEAHSHRRRCR